MKVKCERRSENPSRTPFEFWPFSFSSFLPSQNHSFTCSLFTQPVVAATTHNASSTSAFTAFTRHPSRFSSPVHGHGLDAIAMGFTVHAHLLQTKTILLLLRTNLLRSLFSFVGLIGGFGAKDAKETVQECVSEFISFITSEYEIDIYFWYYF